MTAPVRTTSVVLGAVSCGLLLLGSYVNRSQAAYSYLFAFIYVCTLLVGALFLLMIGHATNATWFVPVRRQCEHITSALPILFPLFLPILLLARELYPWTHWQSLPVFDQQHVKQKLTWLSLPFFECRSGVYIGLFVLFGERLRRWSVRQDCEASGTRAQRAREAMVRLCVTGLVVLSFVLTFASWDWVMSLEPSWYSNLYGVYLFSGGLLSALALMGIAVVFARSRGVLPTAVSNQHYHAIGKLQLTMVIFWAYIGWCHVLQQWIADLPSEVSWYVKRWHHGWQWEGWALVVLHFAIPFLFLLLRSTKRNPKALFTVSVWLLIAHAIDVHYLVLPVLHSTRFVWHWLDLAALVAVSSLSLLLGSLRAQRVAAMPVNDPLLARGLAYQSDS